MCKIDERCQFKRRVAFEAAAHAVVCAAVAQEVEYFQKMEVRDYHNDLILAEVCRHDVLKHCKKVGSGVLHLPKPAQAGAIDAAALSVACSGAPQNDSLQSSRSLAALKRCSAGTHV